MIKICVGINDGILPYDLKRLIDVLKKQTDSGFEIDDDISIDFIRKYDKTAIVIEPETVYDTKYKKLESILKEIQKQHDKEFDIEMK